MAFQISYNLGPHMPVRTPRNIVGARVIRAEAFLPNRAPVRMQKTVDGKEIAVFRGYPRSVWKAAKNAAKRQDAGRWFSGATAADTIKARATRAKKDKTNG